MKYNCSKRSKRSMKQMMRGVLFAALFTFSPSYLLTCPVSAQVAHVVSARKNLADANQNGMVTIETQSAVKGKKVTVYSEPNNGYGLSRGVFYATVKNGVYSETQKADNVSNYPENLANKLTFTFDMPDENVEVWAYFAPARLLMIHPQDEGELRPLYGYKGSDYTKAWNMPSHPIELKIKPKTGYELVDVDVVNIERSRCQRTSDDILTVYMPNEADTVHITPIFGKINYNVKVEDTNTDIVEVTPSNTKPKSREEVELVLKYKQGFIPKNVSITGCKSWWRDGKPQLLNDGRWQIVYRFKVDRDDVTIKAGHEQVYAFSVEEKEASGRIQTYVPEMIPDFPGVARNGQKVPVLFQMPLNYKVTYTAKAGDKAITPVVYHNVLDNSFADQGMSGWMESSDYVGKGMPMRVDVDSVGNKYWRTSVRNTMSQSVSLAGRTYPANAVKNGKVDIAALASINPCKARKAEVSIVTNGKSKQTVANLSNQDNGWETVFMTGTISTTDNTLDVVVDAEADDPNKKRGYGGPMFDDLCLLLPTDGTAVKDEDVMLFTMGDKNVTIEYTASASQATVSVAAKAHATVTLHNTNTGEQGTSVKAIDNDVIVVKGKYDEGYAIYDMKYQPKGSSAENLRIDSINTATREVTYHLIMNGDQNATVTPVVDKQKVYVKNYYGGTFKVDNENSKAGDTVRFTVKPNAGCKLKQIRTVPEDVVTINADSVDATTGAGKYSFIMPTTHVSLSSEYIVPITTVAQLDSIQLQYGDFNLENDLNLGTKWTKTISIRGHFNGNGHRITFGGTSCLFHTIYSNASVCHLNVTGNVKCKKQKVGIIAQVNNGVIEDCEVRGTVKNESRYSTAAGVVGENTPDGNEGIVSHCHILCVIDGPIACGVTSMRAGATLKDNIFNGKFVSSDGQAYMICNNVKNSTIEGNYYLVNDSNARGAVPTGGVVKGNPVDLVNMAKDLTATYPVFAASIRNEYDAYTITVASATDVTLKDISSATGGPGTVISGSVEVSGNNHLESIIITALDGSDPQSCTFNDNTENVYSFSFTMPEHDVIVNFKTKVGKYIYTVKQLLAISDLEGTYILARDLDLNNWEKRVNLNSNFYGNGHFIRYNASGSFKALFQNIRKDALLDGLYVIGNVESDVNCAGIAYENQGTIRNCHFSGHITKLAQGNVKNEMHQIGAIACKVGDYSLIDHCSATGELTCPGNQVPENEKALCPQSGAKITNSVWISSTQTNKYQDLLNTAQAALNDYPVYAQGILDKINARLIVGNDTLLVPYGQTLDELVITDGEPFICTSDVKVKRIVYKRQPMNGLDQWVLPFAFNRIAGQGKFEYHKTIEEKKLPDIMPGQTLTLSNNPASVAYKANEPWMVKGAANEYVLTNADGPVTIKATYNNMTARYASIMDIGTIYTTYENIPAMTAREGLVYVWDVANQRFACADSLIADIQPCRFYMQFYNKPSMKYVKYNEAAWAKNNNKKTTSGRRRAPQQRLASAIDDGWQPIFLDPRQPQSVTAHMLDYYEVAYLADIYSDGPDEDNDSELSAVSLVYQIVDSRMDLPTAIPLLVRAKRSDAEPLVDEQTATELDTLITKSLLQEFFGYETGDTLDFEMPHYWCASFGNRLDIWPMPSPERYADMADTGCMMFSDNGFDLSFIYTNSTDTRTSAPMSYCITLLNSETYELMPLMGNRVNVLFYEPDEETTDINNVKRETITNNRYYDLQGRKVAQPTKGLYIVNGRKVIIK